MKPSNETPIEVDVPTALKLKNYQVVDVREQVELLSEPMPLANSIHLPMSNFSADVFNQGQSYLVVCAYGVRSLQVAQYLRSQGFEAVSLAGGVTALYAAGINTPPN